MQNTRILRQKSMSDLKKMLPTDFFDIYLFQLREPQILKRSMWVQYARSKMLNFLGGGVNPYQWYVNSSMFI